MEADTVVVTLKVYVPQEQARKVVDKLLNVVCDLGVTVDIRQAVSSVEPASS